MACGGLPLLEQIEGLPGGHVERGCSEGVERGHRVGTGQVPSHVQAVMLGRKVKRGVETGALTDEVAQKMIEAMDIKNKHSKKYMVEKFFTDGRSRRRELATLEREARDINIKEAFFVFFFF